MSVTSKTYAPTPAVDFLSPKDRDAYDKILGQGKYAPEQQPTKLLQVRAERKLKKDKRAFLRKMRYQNRGFIAHTGRTIIRAMSSKQNLIRHLAWKHGNVAALAYAEMKGSPVKKAPEFKDLTKTQRSEYVKIAKSRRDPQKQLEKQIFGTRYKARAARKKFDKMSADEQSLHILINHGPVVELAYRDVTAPKMQAQQNAKQSPPTNNTSKPVVFSRGPAGGAPAGNAPTRPVHRPATPPTIYQHPFKI